MKKFLVELSVPVRKHLYIYLLLFILTSVFVSSILILRFESNYSSSEFKTINDAIWWSAVGISTIGIGNILPVSDAGKYLTLFLMLVGVVVLSVLTAKIAAFFTEEEVKKDLDVEFRAIEGDIHKVEKNIEGEVRIDDKIVEDKLEKLEKKVEKLTKRK